MHTLHPHRAMARVTPGMVFVARAFTEDTAVTCEDGTATRPFTRDSDFAAICRVSHCGDAERVHDLLARVRAALPLVATCVRVGTT